MVLATPPKQKGYKQTEIGLIPEDWDAIHLSKIADIARGKFAHRPRNEPRFYGGAIPFIQTGDVNKAHGFVKTYTQTLNEDGLSISRLFKRGTIAMTIAANIGDVGLLEIDACFPDSLVGINAHQPDDNLFLLYSLQNLKKSLDIQAPKSAQKNINLDIINKLVIPYPSREEREAIGRLLWSTDQSIIKTKKVIAQTKTLRTTLMRQLLTRGIPGWHKEFKDTPLGKMPANWRVAEIKEVAEILDSQRIPLNEEQRQLRQGTVPYYGANGIVDYIDDSIFNEPLVLLAEDGGQFNEFSSRPIALKVTEKCWVNNHAHVLRPRDTFDLDWLFYNLVHKDIRRFIKGGTRGKLNRADLLRIPLAYPPQRERLAISEVFLHMDKFLDISQSSAVCLRETKQALMQNLLTGKIRVGDVG